MQQYKKKDAAIPVAAEEEKRKHKNMVTTAKNWK